MGVFFSERVKTHRIEAFLVFMEPTVAAQIIPETRKGKKKKIEFIKDKKRMFCLLTNVQNTTLSDTLQSRTVAASLTVLTPSIVFASVFL